MTFSALLIDAETKLRALGTADLVRGMAMNAGGTAIISLGKQLAVNALIVEIFNKEMASATCLRDILFADAGFRMVVGLNIVGPVTVMARRCYDETINQQRLAVNGIDKMTRRFDLGGLTVRRHGAGTMTCAACFGESESINAGAQVADRVHIMATMAA